ncbi:MAG: DNA circularization N-terminal domain-containing protein [Deltaproteobacteria bacterium]|nr:DNA circularization N-terminal domain-containing protein [Deltaproteobacteria bacterium]
MSDWEKRFRRAYFRGVPFYVETSELTTGRRVVQHEFPDQDIPYAEDLGKKGQVFQITGYVLGEDYFNTRDALIRACEKEGPGTLIHPYLGIKKVQCESLNLREDRREGRIATFQLSFLEAGENRFPSAIKNIFSEILDQFREVITDVEAFFIDGLDLVNLPAFVFDSAKQTVDSITTLFEEALQTVKSPSDKDKVAEVTYKLERFKSQSEGMLQGSPQLFESFSEVIEALGDLSTENTESLEMYLTLAQGINEVEEELPEIFEKTSTRSKEKKNRDILLSTARVLFAVNAAQKFIDSDFRSLEEAQEKREEIQSILIEEAEESKNDSLYQSLSQLHASLTEVFPQTSQELSRIIEYTPPVTMPSLVIIYDLFQDPELEQDLLDRNKIIHPGFIPGGESLEVLNG